MKMKSTILVAGVFLFAITLAGCKSSKKAVDSTFGKEVTVPCSDEEFHTDSKYFRGTGNGISIDLSTARNKAKMDANTNLAQSINTTLKSVSERYVNERQFDASSEFEQKFEQLTREVVNQQRNNVEVACYKTTQMKDGKFQVFTAVQVSKDEVLNNIANRISKDKKLQVYYDKMKFEQIFNEEMSKLESERP
ncbi:MAG TPA: hypothetical protein DCP10_04880 [Bacteroidales bacterium]|nr:hypothetical protein [Bacteroidales bacterium]